jgi:hypothetical protein
VRKFLQTLETCYTPPANPLEIPTHAEFDCVADLQQLAHKKGWDATEEDQTEMYKWVFDNLWPLLDRRILGLASPGPPTSREMTGSGRYWPIELAARDYLVALKVPVLYLDPANEPQVSLFKQFLENAPSPIPVTGVFATNEEKTVALVSRYGDWISAMTWPGAALTCGNLTVFSAVRPIMERYEPMINSDRIMATLGDGPVVTMWMSDGDALFYQMQGGFSFFPWESVKNQRFGWSQNPILVDLAPVIWNYYATNRTEASLIAGLSGAGYTRPQPMSSDQLDAYLEKTLGYWQQTGLRTVQIDHQEGRIDREIATRYYESLHDVGYLGAFEGHLVEGPMYFAYLGVPAPVVQPSHNFRFINQSTILEDLLSLKPGEVFTDIAEPHINHNLQIIQDDTAFGGKTALVPREFAQAPSCCMAVAVTQMTLAPGEYEVSYRLKVTESHDTRPIAGLSVGAQGLGQNFAYQSISPADFEEANQYLDFAVSFTLKSVTSGVEFWVDYLGGSTELMVDTIHAVQIEGSRVPIFAPLYIMGIDDPEVLENMRYGPELLGEALEASGGIMLTPEEFLAALNPEYMLEFATPMLGADHPALLKARDLMDNGNFLESLLTIRSALRDYLETP